MEEENLLGDSRRWCLHARPPVVSKLTGFQDSEPGVDFGLFGAVTWAGRRCRRLSWVHRPRTTGPARVWRSRRKAQGWCGPQRSEDTALRALTDRHRWLRSRDWRW